MKIKELDGTNSIGTFKADILEIDNIVRAINNYVPEGKKGSIEYFHELQYTTMLRIMCDSGVRFSEVVNMPFGTLQYLEEEDVHIIILGWSKLNERFGVVPIGKKTAQMLAECEELRVKFPMIELEMRDKTQARTKLNKYIMQFVSVVERIGRVSLISDKQLTAHFDKICENAGVTRTKGKRFHAIRHRAAEYFFFCMSYYDFERKNDFEYKEKIIKRLLRHHDNEMTRQYYWGNLTNLINEGKLVFLKSLPDISQYDDPDSKYHQESVINRIKKDLETDLSNGSVHRIIKLLTLPHGLISQTVLEEISKSKSFKTVLDYLINVDGNKGRVPPGGASFGKCTNSSCPLLKERTTCISCMEHHILTKEDIDLVVREIVRISGVIQEVYKKSYEDTSSREHLKSLRSRISFLIERLTTEFDFTPKQLFQKIEEQIGWVS